MRYLALVLVLLAGTASAGTVNPAPIATDATATDPGLKHFVRKLNSEACASLRLVRTCTQPEATAAATAQNRPAPTIYPTTIAGYEAYLQTLIAPIILDHAAQGFAYRAEKEVLAAYKAADPATKAKAETNLGVQ